MYVSYVSGRARGAAGECMCVPVQHTCPRPCRAPSLLRGHTDLQVWDLFLLHISVSATVNRLTQSEKGQVQLKILAKFKVGNI